MDVAKRFGGELCSIPKVSSNEEIVDGSLLRERNEVMNHDTEGYA